MPRLVSEITSGAQFSRSSEEGRLADSQTRVFRVLKAEPSEYINIPEVCGVNIGYPHPQNPGIYCTSFDGRYEGDSRMVLICTFQYASTPTSSESSQDRKQQPPDTRPANWSVSSVVYEAPAYLWKPITGPGSSGDSWVVPANPVGDRYEGAIKMQPLVTFNIEQYEPTDPSRWVLVAGSVNTSRFQIGSFVADPRTLMFKGVQCQPVAESWGDQLYRGWKATYEFVYKANYCGDSLGNIGWDIAMPQTGFNILNLESALGGGENEVGSLALEHGTDGKIKNWPDDPDVAVGTSGRKVRAMILTHAYSSGGASQLPCAQPIPLNDDGTPRASSATPKVKVYRYQVQGDFDFSRFNIRLF